jgi:hypothetical protein
MVDARKLSDKRVLGEAVMNCNYSRIKCFGFYKLKIQSILDVIK